MVWIETEDGDLINLARFDGVRKNQGVPAAPFYIEAWRFVDGKEGDFGLCAEECVRLAFLDAPEGVSHQVKEDLAFDKMDDLRIALEQAGVPVIGLLNERGDA